jgi:anti-sigma B factor antagonist
VQNVLDPTPSTSRGTGFVGTDGGLEVSIAHPRDGLAVLSVGGEIDTLTTTQLETALAELFATSGDGRFVVDLSGVTFLASSGLAVLIRASQLSEARGARLRLVTTTRAVRRPLEVTGCDQLFDVFTDLDTATADHD